jgi:ribosomal protein L16 Arg81 hydroxylase
MSQTSNNGSHDNPESTEESSQALNSILKNKMTQAEFFNEAWQQKAVVFPFSGTRHPDSSSITGGGDGRWNEDRMQEAVLEEIVHQGWHILTQILEQPRPEQSSSSEVESQTPLIFQNRDLQHPDKIRSMYGHSLFTPYLDGCSVVLNHADLLSPWIAALCENLQKSFPHAYANCYLTPPGSQAVPPHADDRDVFVLQLVGSKSWRVYGTVPVPYPYPDEQVGKEGIPVPPSVLEGPLSLATTLEPGDCLYMPRGYVHEAHCQEKLSFHITIALATHDWTLAGIISAATKHILTRVVDYRKSILPTHSDPKVLQAQVDSAMTMIQERVTAESILSNLHSKLDKHNRRAFSLRMKCIHEARFPPVVAATTRMTTTVATAYSNVGPLAAEKTTFTTVIRAATAEERAHIASAMNSEPRGLNVREEMADSIMGIISKIKVDPTIRIRVIDLRSLDPAPANPLVCDLTLLSLAKRCVELGALAVD